MLSVSGSPDSVGETPMLTASAFQYVGNAISHTGSTWSIEHNGTVIWTHTSDTDLESVQIPVGVLTAGTHTFKVVYHSNTISSTAGVVTAVVVIGGSNG